MIGIKTIKFRMSSQGMLTVRVFCALEQNQGPVMIFNSSHRLSVLV